jgi:hypothetical protein
LNGIQEVGGSTPPGSTKQLIIKLYIDGTTGWHKFGPVDAGGRR